MGRPANCLRRPGEIQRPDVANDEAVRTAVNCDRTSRQPLSETRQAASDRLVLAVVALIEAVVRRLGRASHSQDSDTIGGKTDPCAALCVFSEQELIASSGSSHAAVETLAALCVASLMTR